MEHIRQTHRFCADETIGHGLSVDETLTRLRAHRNNIHRYRRLLATKLSDLERGYVRRRMNEESEAMQKLSELSFPLALHMPNLTSATDRGASHA